MDGRLAGIKREKLIHVSSFGPRITAAYLLAHASTYTGRNALA